MDEAVRSKVEIERRDVSVERERKLEVRAVQEVDRMTLVRLVMF